MKGRPPPNTECDGPMGQREHGPGTQNMRSYAPVPMILRTGTRLRRTPFDSAAPWELSSLTETKRDTTSIDTGVHRSSSMLRHASALRVSAACSWRAGARDRGRHACVAASRGSRARHGQIPPPPTSPSVVFCSHLHHDARRRRDGSQCRTTPAPHTTSLLSLGSTSSKRLGLERGALAAIARAQRATFSAEEGGGSGSRSKAEVAQSGMDAETRRSIGEGDKKSKDSMKTVKLALAGNLIITLGKFLAYLHSGSSAMSSEAMHSLVDSANQLLLVVGLRSAATAPDKRHQYGYGKSVYFWALVSALGTFWLGAGVSMRHSIEELINPTVALDKVGMEVWSVLGLSLLIDGYVLVRTFGGIWESKPDNLSFKKHLKNLRDPTTLAVLLEDGAACLGVLMAMGGIGLSQYYQNPVFDSLAGVSIAGLLGVMGLVLTEVNRRFLIGQSVDSETVEGIKAILMSRGSIEQLHQVQTQWVGTHTFAFKAEVDFDGTFLAAKLKVNTRYGQEFRQLLARPPDDKAKFKDHETLLSFYTEDVMRAAEREVREAETEIRKKYPEAAFIELEPDSSTHNMFALEQFQTPALRKVEETTLNQMLANLVIAKKAAATTAVAEAKARKEKAKTSSSSSSSGGGGGGGGGGDSHKKAVSTAAVPEFKRRTDTTFAADGWTSEGRREEAWGGSRGAGGNDDAGEGPPKQR